MRQKPSNGRIPGGGGAYSCDRLVNNIIARNSSARSGGGASNCPYVANNTFWMNTAEEKGGGYYQRWGNAVPINCIFWGNTAPDDPQVSGCTPTYSLIQDWFGTVDIINADPMLVNPDANDFHLLPDSPCIDAGKRLPEIIWDFEGDRRGQKAFSGNRGDGSFYDIGADEATRQGTGLKAGARNEWIMYR